jgi:hypothetical protein
MELAEFVVYKNIKEEYISYRKLSTDFDFKAIDDKNAFVSEIINKEYIKIKTMLKGKIIYIVLVYSKSKYSEQVAKLKILLEDIGTAAEKKENKIDEIILVVRNEFLNEKRLMNVIAEKQGEEKDIYYRVCPFYMFVMNVMKKPGAPQNPKIMTDTEIEAYLNSEFKTKQDLNTISSKLDPEVIWLGAKKGQFIEHYPFSENSCEKHEIVYVI